MQSAGWFVIAVAAILVLGIAASKTAEKKLHSNKK